MNANCFPPRSRQCPGRTAWTGRRDSSCKHRTGRYQKTTTYAEYVEEVAKKILQTKRFQYAIYSANYGVDFLADIGKMRSQISLPVIKRQAEEALEAHVEIEQSEVVDIAFVGDKVVFTVQIEGARGKTKMEVDIWQR
ncbi:UNVERIFIED_CONTAM: hypothetical protein ABID98_000943 [Brevibacillus sp. OAP136]